ncbi:hypothetical protein CLV78_104299 [Aliiruegeria haliotis]|uniref:Uncharacterized protein n=1 Tax=Aliiruegeria haliotis TaxID=1280846 RepID=A0A2T0RRH7_9RHOB|nr:hypothetical protein [Aliiruegeria haliotis]PRY23806.1 hypothetical protein CLV78_104299 [Aliiruegeria haliotis]
MPFSAALARVCALSCLVFLAPIPGAAEQKGIGKLFRASTKAPTVVEQGPVAKACGVRGKSLGKVVEKGPGKWKLYDTAPGSTGVRDFYLSGFGDGCPRKLRGAVAMFGSVELYEMVHYGPVGLKPTGAATDLAYARMRASTCGSAKKACKRSGVKKMSRKAVFVDVYQSAGNSRRLELLMSGGRLKAVSEK